MANEVADTRFQNIRVYWLAFVVYWVSFNIALTHMASASDLYQQGILLFGYDTWVACAGFLNWAKLKQ